MSVRKQFEKHFSEDNLNRIFSEHIVYSGAVGIDNLTQYTFRRQLDEQVGILSRKVLAGTYQFTKYKLKLVSKGRGKVPREISIPTVRDRIALRALCDFLSERFKESISFDLPQNIVKRIKADVYSGAYTGCIKLDVADFYPSIKHSELISRLRKRVRDPEILSLVSNSISVPTVTKSRESDLPAVRGVPQGLAVSNVLAAVYLINIDKYLLGMPGIRYYRYVDDVLIFCDFKSADDISRSIMKRFSKIGLSVYDPIKAPKKSSIGKITDTFGYLGYKFEGDMVTARQGSVDSLKESLVAIFTNYKHASKKSEQFLLWRLNMRITGCVFDNQSKGWLFFFSEINHESLLHILDNFVCKLMVRFNVDVKPKKFVRAFKELSHRKYETSYIPNFDNYDLEQKKEVLMRYFNLSLKKYTDDEIEFEFHKRIGKQVKDLLVDVKNFAY